MQSDQSRPGGAVKPGDLAIVRRSGSLNYGRIVEVLEVAPADDFTLPDGTECEGAGSQLVFVCKGIGGPLRIITYGVGIVTGWFCCFCACPECLRPLPGDDVPEVERHTDEVTA